LVRLRLSRLGRKKRPYYRIVAVDSRGKRDGGYIERLGYYHPLENPPAVDIDADKVLKWLRLGAQPSETVLSLLRKEGVWLRFRLEKRKMPESQINELMAQWFAKHASEREKNAAAKLAIEEAKAVAKLVEKEAAAEEPLAEEPAAEEPTATEKAPELDGAEAAPEAPMDEKTEA